MVQRQNAVGIHGGGGGGIVVVMVALALIRGEGVPSSTSTANSWTKGWRSREIERGLAFFCLGELMAHFSPPPHTLHRLMILAMSFNTYVFFSIILGFALGKFLESFLRRILPCKP